MKRDRQQLPAGGLLKERRSHCVNHGARVLYALVLLASILLVPTKAEAASDQQRIAHVLGLWEDPALDRVAQLRAEELAHWQVLTHFYADGSIAIVHKLDESGMDWDKAGEVLYRSNVRLADEPEFAVESWHQSPSHAYALAWPNPWRIGVGVAYDAKGWIYYVAVVAN